MGRSGCHCLHGSNLSHKDRASWPDAHPLSVSPATKNGNSSRWSTPTARRRRWPFAVALSFAVMKPTGRPTGKLPENSGATPAPSVNGGNALPPDASTAWTTYPAAVPPALFPPEDRHKVLVLATTKPADLGLPFSHWSLEDLATQIINDAHYRDMSRSTIARILNFLQRRRACKGGDDWPRLRPRNQPLMSPYALTVTMDTKACKRANHSPR
jgi:hypothetical protein